MDSNRFSRAAAAFARLCRTMATLRAPGGCPWDREQSLESLKPFLIEETYEVLDAMDGDQDHAHKEELGDLLLQIVFQAEITWEEGRFDMAAVADAINDKLMRRHPHVFGDVVADDAAGALDSWEKQKAAERPASQSCLEGIPRSLPALLKALKTGEKAAAVGFDWPSEAGVRQKVEEELRELAQVAESPSAARNEEMGDLLFSLVNLCRHWGINPEMALGRATNKFQMRFRWVESQLLATGKRPSDCDFDLLDALWKDAKSRDGDSSPEGG